MSRVKIKKKFKISEVLDGDIGAKFLGGDESIDRNILSRKLSETTTALLYIEKTLIIICKSAIISEESSLYAIETFAKEIESTRLQVPQLLLDVPAWQWTDEAFSDAKRIWTLIKKSTVITQLSSTCANLKDFQKHITGDTKNARALYNAVYITWLPLTFAPLDVKALLSMENHAKICLSLLEKIWINGMIIHRNATTPDFDINNTVDHLLKNMEQLLKIPELSRCSDAIAYIKKSAGMLRENFTEYHKDYVESGNPTTFMQSFLGDIVKGGNADVKVIVQLKKIMAYYEKSNDNSEIEKKRMQLMTKLANNLERNIADPTAASPTIVDDEIEFEVDGD